MKLSIGKYEVTIKDSLTWGDAQKVQAALASGMKVGTAGFDGKIDGSVMIEAKYALLEVAIIKIQPLPEVSQEGGVSDPEPIPFSRDWMNALSIEEGDALYAAVDALNKKK